MKIKHLISTAIDKDGFSYKQRILILKLVQLKAFSEEKAVPIRYLEYVSDFNSIVELLTNAYPVISSTGVVGKRLVRYVDKDGSVFLNNCFFALFPMNDIGDRDLLYPIIPYHLISSCPSYRKDSLIELILQHYRHDYSQYDVLIPYIDVCPRCSILTQQKQQLTVYGNFNINDDGTIHISEFPPLIYQEKVQKTLNKLKQKGLIESFIDLSTEKEWDITVWTTEKSSSWTVDQWAKQLLMVSKVQLPVIDQEFFDYYQSWLTRVDQLMAMKRDKKLNQLELTRQKISLLEWAEEALKSNTFNATYIKDFIISRQFSTDILKIPLLAISPEEMDNMRVKMKDLQSSIDQSNILTVFDYYMTLLKNL